ncbi:hypothetical protein PENSPDRAFT_739917 [Peniophora sp. CONT]|nr:hypothetical protein PENSPDRAFT_739917 [Peniophora sp. CONT]
MLGCSFLGSEEYISATELVLQHLRRAEVIDILLMPNCEEDHEDIQDLLDKISSLDASTASTVTLCLSNSDGDWEPTTLPWNLLSGVDSPSRLTRINFSDCIAPVTTPWLSIGSNLRKVILCNSIVWDATDSMVAFFQALPMLEDFELDFFRDQTPLYHSFTKARHSRCIRLDHLRSLDLRHYWLDNLVIFMCICMPSNTRLRLLSLEYGDYLDRIPRHEVLEYYDMGKETLSQHFAPAIVQGSSYDAVSFRQYGRDPEEGRFTIEVVPSHMNSWYPKGEHPGSPPLLPTNICFDLPRTSKHDIRRAAAAMLATLPIFTGATTMPFSKLLWSLYPEAYDAYTAVTTLRVCGEADAEVVRSILCTRGASFLPTMKCLRLDFVRKVDVIAGILDALRDAHASTQVFERLELYECGNGRDTLRSIIAGKSGGVQPNFAVACVSR